MMDFTPVEPLIGFYSDKLECFEEDGEKLCRTYS